MAGNYFQPVNDHFGYDANVILEDVEDDIFLNSNNRPRLDSPPNYASNMGPSPSNVRRSTNPFEMDEPELEEQRRQMLDDRRRQIEEQTLHSTQKSLGLLYETEEVGKATAVELAKQREQLENTSRQLDEINASLRFSQRHLNSLKSVFGGLKNYLSGNRDNSTNKFRPSNGSPASEDGPTENSAGASGYHHASYDDHPIAHLRNPMEPTQSQRTRNTNPFEVQLEANLEEMCGNLSRLKGLATDMNQEIESQNELLDNMNYKIEDVDIKMAKQNKEMNKLMGKK